MRKGEKIKNLGKGAAMSFEDIGGAMGLSRGTVWMIYKRAMRKLHKGRRHAAMKRLLDLAKSKEDVNV